MLKHLSPKRALTVALVALLAVPAMMFTQTSYADNHRGHYRGHDRGKHQHYDKHHRYNDQNNNAYRFNASHRSLLGRILSRNRNSVVLYPNNTRYRRVYNYQPVSYWNPSTIAIGRPLPPGIARNVVYLPSSVNPRFGLGRNHRLAVVNNDVLITSMVTGAVVDILRNVL